MHLSVTQFCSLVFFGSNTTAISIGPASSGMAAHDFHGMLAQFQEGIILISRCRMEWGSLSATNLVALVPDLNVRKVVFCVLRSGTSATGFVAERVRAPLENRGLPYRGEWVIQKYSQI